MMAIDLSPIQPWEYAALRPYLERHWQMLYDVLWYTGIRISEALALRRDDLTGAMLRVKRLKRSSTMIDDLPIPRDVAEALRLFMQGQRRKRIFAHGNHETPYTDVAANYALKRAAAKAKVRTTLHSHLFRHSLGERADAAGMSTAMIARMLGHSGEGHVARYRRPSLERVQAEMRKLQGGVV